MNKQLKGREVIIFDKQDLDALVYKIDSLVKMCEKLVSENVRLKSDYWLTIEEAAAYTGFSVDWLARRQADIGYSNPGGAGRRFKKDKLDAYMNKYNVQYKTGRIRKSNSMREFPD